MLKRHEDGLLQRIDTIAWRGFAFVEWWELNAWYGKDRIGKAIWRDLRRRFDEAAEDETARLYIYEVQNGVLFVHSDGLKEVTSNGLVPLLGNATEDAPEADDD